ncbi:MAG: NAD+ synthase [Bifidobacteriaceae bacterium]|nr:NAD+ synthase [Bifidobacteriaceae bacterium]
MKLALAQINPTVGDILGNRKKILDYSLEALQAGAEVVIFPELAIAGYPIEDLALRTDFVQNCEANCQELATELVSHGAADLWAIVGCPTATAKTGQAFRSDYQAPQNSLVVLHGGEQVAEYHKQVLPNYGVFDEYRTFTRGTEPTILHINGQKLGLMICEDLWEFPGPAEQLQGQIDLLISAHASPFWDGKMLKRIQVAERISNYLNVPVAYVNQVGGQDELIFDGRSFYQNSDTTLSVADPFVEQLLLIDTDGREQMADGSLQNAASSDHQAFGSANRSESDCISLIYDALVMSLRDYCHKNQFKSVVLGVSGGIDSALVATIAADAIGGSNVYGISMPAAWSSSGSVTDAKALVDNLGAHWINQPIIKVLRQFQLQIDVTGTTFENLQARIRGNIIMTYSNLLHALALATGNKSELAVGYSTAFGDSVGGFAPIKDVWKTQVYQLAEFRNSLSDQPVIPLNSITKPPSAELRPGQKDSDTLGDYADLDRILQAYVEHRLVSLLAANSDSDVTAALASQSETQSRLTESAVSAVSDEADVSVTLEPAPGTPAVGSAAVSDSAAIDLDFLTVAQKVDRAEWKRRVYPIGPKVSALAFGRDRRVPVTNLYNNES